MASSDCKVKRKLDDWWYLRFKIGLIAFEKWHEVSVNNLPTDCCVYPYHWQANTTREVKLFWGADVMMGDMKMNSPRKDTHTEAMKRPQQKWWSWCQCTEKKLNYAAIYHVKYDYRGRGNRQLVPKPCALDLSKWLSRMMMLWIDSECFGYEQDTLTSTCSRPNVMGSPRLQECYSQLQEWLTKLVVGSRLFSWTCLSDCQDFSPSLRWKSLFQVGGDLGHAAKASPEWVWYYGHAEEMRAGQAQD